MKKKKQKRKYKSRYQSGGLQNVPTNLSDTPTSPIQRGQQSGLLSNTQNIMQQLLQKQNIKQQQQQQTTAENIQRQQQHQAAAQQQSGRGTQQLPRLFATGGMYADNTVSAAGQGGIGSTANIVFDQSNPAVLQQKMNFLADTKAKIQAENEDAVSSIKETDEQGKIDIEQSSAEQQAKVDMAGNVIGAGLQAGKQSGVISKDAGSLGLKDAVKAYKAQKAINLASQSKDIGTAAQAAEVAGTAGTVGSGVQAATTGSGIVSGTASGVTSGGFGAVTSGTQAAQTAGTAATTASTAGQTGSAVAAGLGTLAKNPNVYALAAQYGGQLIKKGADDQDATTWNTGEATGDILGTAGKYAGYGAMLTSWLGPGAALGAAVGGVIGAGVGTYKGLTSRNKARKAKEVWQRKRKKKVDAYNQELKSNLLTANAQVRAGEIEQKTYSGYDLGRNVVAKMGGMRMGMPRYGYTS